MQLQQDRGHYYWDKNAARFPEHPLAPAVAASLATSPANLDDVDVVACGSTLGNILRFVRGQDKKCRILVERAGKAIFLIRRENSPTELIPDVRGFGHTFPEAYTTWDPVVKSSTSHQRIVKYRFGGMKFLVRFEADGYLDGEGKQDMPSAGRINAEDSSLSHTLDTIENITNLVLESTLSLSQQLPSPGVTSMQLRTGGRAVDQSRIFNLKTRSRRTIDRDHMREELPRLWVSQIPNFILAFHTNGHFRKADIYIHDTRKAVQSWELENKEELVRLATLIRHIVNLSGTSSVDNGKLELTLDGSGRLDVRKQLLDAGDVLPTDLKVKWELACGSAQEDAKTVKDDADGADDGGGAAVEAGSYDWKDAGDDLTKCSEHCGYCGSCV